MRTAGRSGFTLPELLLITVLLGLLAMIGTSLWWSARDRAVQASLQSELRALRTAQEAHFAVHGAYAGSVEALAFEPKGEVEAEVSVPRRGPPSGVPGEAPPEGTPPRDGAEGWAGRLTHAPSGVRCAVFYGDAEELDPAEVEEVVKCRSE